MTKKNYKTVGKATVKNLSVRDLELVRECLDFTMLINAKLDGPKRNKNGHHAEVSSDVAMKLMRLGKFFEMKYEFIISESKKRKKSESRRRNK